jgi:hypothetical protein
MRLSTVRTFALSLPETTEAPHHHFSSFRVRGRIFVTIPPGDDVIHVFVGEDDRERTLAMYPEWAGKLTWGAKAVGLRITLAPARAAIVRTLVRAAYDARAAKR